VEALFEAVFVAGVAVVALSLVGVLVQRVTPRILLILTGVLACASAAATAALGIDLVSDFASTDALVLAAAGLALCAVAEAGLFALSRGLIRLRQEERLIAAGEAHIEAVLAASAKERATELDRTLARERANTAHLLSQQERKLSVERRDLIARQADRARSELATSIEQVQERLEQRLAAWAADLDRGQRVLEKRLNDLATRQNEAIKTYEARLAADSEYLRTATEEQQRALGRLRAELAKVGEEVLQAGRSDLEVQADENRKALQELTLKMRESERTVREQLDHAESEALLRIQSAFEDVEKKQRDALTRSLDRAAGRLAEDAERRFDTQIRTSREKSAQRLSNELDKSMEQFARSAEKEISDRIGDAAQNSAQRLERRVGDIVKGAEAQSELAAERLKEVSERLNTALAQAERRIKDFEAQIELQMSMRRDQLDQALRASDS